MISNLKGKVTINHDVRYYSGNCIMSNNCACLVINPPWINTVQMKNYYLR